MGIRVIVTDIESDLFTVEFNWNLVNALADKVKTRDLYNFDGDKPEVIGSVYTMAATDFMSIVQRMIL